MFISNRSFDSFINCIQVESEYWETNAYIKSVLRKYINAEKDLSKKSLTLLWFEAIKEGCFEKLQDIGDWAFFTRVIFPESFNSADLELYENFGRSSYYKCYKFLNGKWPLYEEMADNFKKLTKEVRISFSLEFQPNKFPSF